VNPRDVEPEMKLFCSPTLVQVVSDSNLKNELRLRSLYQVLIFCLVIEN